MLLFFLMTTIVIFTLSLLFIVGYALYENKSKPDFSALLNGFKTALKDCGFFLSSPHSNLNQYRWMIVKDTEDVCDDCLELTKHPAMDIADWMQQELPDANTPLRPCKNDCQCELMMVKRNRRTV